LLAEPVATVALPEAVELGVTPTTWVCVLVGMPVVDRLPTTAMVVETESVVLLLLAAALVVVEETLLDADMVEALALDDEALEPLMVLEVPEEEEVEEPVDLPPVIGNGNEYWKVVGLESSWIFRPYTASLPSVDGTDQEYLPAELTTLAAGQKC
jgi:hypothetical protein